MSARLFCVPRGLPVFRVSLLFNLFVFSSVVFSQIIDPTFAPVLQDFTESSGSSRAVVSLVQPDGKILVGGVFTVASGLPRSGIARFNADGSLDATFNTGAGFTNGLSVIDTAIAPDGKIYIVGDFQIFNDATRWRVARLNANGSIDVTFNTSTPLAGNVAAVSVLPDGKIFIVGAFPFPPAQNFYNNIARMNTDGSYDTNFNNASVTFEGEGYAIRQQPDGKVLIGGTLTVSNGLLADGITRLNSDGTLDLNFFRNPDGGIVFDMERQSDG
ncbi:MAG TPA: hypothetical protein VGB00_03365, partial [Pyrinomonadaceae bacterium]